VKVIVDSFRYGEGVSTIWGELLTKQHRVQGIEMNHKSSESVQGPRHVALHGDRSMCLWLIGAYQRRFNIVIVCNAPKIVYSISVIVG
jgi:hypothetical protein